MSLRTELVQLTRIRLMLFVREPEAVFWVFVFPVVLALVLGLAFRGRGAEPSPAGVVRGSVDATWLAALEADEAIDLAVFDDADELARKLRSGAVAVWIREGEDGVLDIRFDPGRPESELARLRVENRVQAQEGRRDPLAVRQEKVQEKGARYIDFLLPGLLGMNLMGTGMWGTGFAIVDWRQKKLLKLFMATPMRRGSFLASQAISRLVFLVAEVAVIGCFGVFVLGVPLRGDVFSFALLCLLGALCFSGLGLLTASRATTIEGVSGLMNFVMMPMWLLSGVFFTYERFPEVLLPVIRVLPLTALNDALRAVMLEGAGLGAVAGAMLVLAIYTVVGFGVALKVFRWR